ncbi:MAG TPA: hypothetical protein VG125_16665 [Pirellulales bacterium]|nr:hypothetical protein [Pirellulales bacterium]
MKLAFVVAWLVASQVAAAADLPAKQDDPGQLDRGRRDVLLKSESWRKTMADLDQWYSAQPIYDQQQVDNLKKQTSRRVEGMSADEIEEFRQDVEAKLTVLQSPEAQDILHWVAAIEAAAAPAYRKKIDIHFPDVAGLNAAQLREQLYLLTQKRSAAQNQTAIRERARAARIAALQAEQRLQYDERDRAFSRGVASFGKAGYSSVYHPSVRQYPEVVSRPAYGFGWGFGFW